MGIGNGSNGSKPMSKNYTGNIIRAHISDGQGLYGAISGQNISISQAQIIFKEYRIPEVQADFARTINPDIIRFFGWTDCAKIIRAYRDRDIGALQNTLIGFFEQLSDKTSISDKKLQRIFRGIMVTIDDYDHNIISTTTDHLNQILACNRGNETINKWLIVTLFQLSDKKNTDGKIYTTTIVETIRGMKN